MFTYKKEPVERFAEHTSFFKSPPLKALPPPELPDEPLDELEIYHIDRRSSLEIYPELDELATEVSRSVLSPSPELAMIKSQDVKYIRAHSPTGTPLPKGITMVNYDNKCYTLIKETIISTLSYSSIILATLIVQENTKIRRANSKSCVIYRPGIYYLVSTNMRSINHSRAA